MFAVPDVMVCSTEVSGIATPNAVTPRRNNHEEKPSGSGSIGGHTSAVGHDNTGVRPCADSSLQLLDMPTVTRRRSWLEHFESGEHDKTHCYGAESWQTGDGRPISEFAYYVVGVPLSERDKDTSEDGWWCENCCRQRGWVW